MTSSEGIRADFRDLYTEGDVITDTKLYDGSSPGYSIEIQSENYTNRTMTIKITK
ncbi:hypothetical protein [Sulfurimonas sp.]